MIKISVKGVDEVRSFLARLGKEAKHFTEGKVTEYLVGDQSHGLKHDPPYKYLGSETEGAYEKVYGGFLSRAQQAYVMARKEEGSIVPGTSVSTSASSNAWQAVDKGRFWEAQNDVAHTRWLVGDKDQSRMMELKGWRKVSQNVKDNLKGAFRHATAELKKWLREQKKR